MSTVIRFEPYFVEEAVFLRIKQIENAVIPAKAGIQAVNFSQRNVEDLDPRFRGDDDQKRLLLGSYHAGRMRLYETVSKEDQEPAFQEFYLKFFRDLGIEKIFMDIVQEFPLLDSPNLHVLVKSTFRKNQEAAELFVEGSSRRVLLNLRVPQVLNPASLNRLLRHELLHVSDMVDPEFRYTPKPVLGGVGEVEETLIRERFRLLWNLYVSARLAQRGHEPFISLSDLKTEFGRSFSYLDDAHKARIIAAFIGKKKWTQSGLILLARNDRVNKLLGEGGLRCPLCHFTSYENRRTWGSDQNPVVHAIRKDFAGWSPAQGLCSQCYDLYESRAGIRV